MGDPESYQYQVEMEGCKPESPYTTTPFVQVAPGDVTRQGDPWGREQHEERDRIEHAESYVYKRSSQRGYDQWAHVVLPGGKSTATTEPEATAYQLEYDSLYLCSNHAQSPDAAE